MAKRYELNDQQWARISDMLPGKKSDPGRTAKDNRLFVNGVLWVLRSGAQWDELPERYGKWKSVHKRFTRWAKNGVWERVPGRNQSMLPAHTGHRRRFEANSGIRTLAGLCPS
jgi:transposase